MRRVPMKSIGKYFSAWSSFFSGFVIRKKSPDFLEKDKIDICAIGFRQRGYMLPKGWRMGPGNICYLFSSLFQKSARAIPDLLLNTREASTDVRWCAALALTEISKNNTESRKKLAPKVKKFINVKQNNEVRNI
jgi:hypothetical protein